MEPWRIKNIVAIWIILRCIPLHPTYTEQCSEPLNETLLADSAEGFAQLFHSNVDQPKTACVRFSAIRHDNIWNITGNCFELDNDWIGQFVSDLERYSSFGLRDSDALFIEACSESGRYGIEAADDIAKQCNKINANCSFRLVVQVSFTMAALEHENMSAWYIKGFKGPAVMFLDRIKNKRPKSKSRAVKSFQAPCKCWTFSSIVIAFILQKRFELSLT